MSPALVRAYIGLGANLGDSAATLRRVLAQLQATDGIDAVTASPFYRSAPVDATGPDFVNAVAALDTRLPPLALLDALQALENQHGRLRPYKNAPRTLDLDLLTYADVSLDHERLILPHPRMHQRAFVLLPLHDLAPDMLVNGRPISTWVAQIPDQAIERLPD